MSSGEKRRGERNGASTLTEAKVRDIRARYRPGLNQYVRGNAAALAAEHGIHRRTVVAIVNEDTWGHLA